MNGFSVLDISIIGFYLLVVLSVGFYASRRKEENSTSYFLAGRNMGWIAIGASMFATNISGEHFIGLAGSGATRGLAVGHFEWMATIFMMLLGWVFVPIYLKSGVFTMPEFLEKRYNTASRMYLTSVSIIAYILTRISVTLFAGGLLLKAALGWDMYTSAVVIVVLTGVYTIIGGLSAVIYTELIQTVFLIGGALVLTILGLNEIGGIEGLRSSLPEDYFCMFKPFSDPDFPWTGILFGAPILGIWYWCTDQYIVQRVLSARNINHARSATIFAGFLKILPVFILVLPGMIAVVLYPESVGDNAYPLLLAGDLLPAGIRGLVMASLLAALMSSLASVFNSTSTLFTMDVYKRFNPGASERKLVLVGRLATTLIVATGILWVPLTRLISSQIYIYLQSIQAYISPPITAVFLFGILSKRMSGKGAIYTLVTGGMIGALRFVLELVHSTYPLTNPFLTWFVELNFLHFAILLFVISSGVLVFVSLTGTIHVSTALPGVTFSYTGSPLLLVTDISADGRSLKWHHLNIVFSVLLIITIFSLWGSFF